MPFQGKPMQNPIVFLVILGEKTFSPSSPKAVSPSSFSQAHPGSPKTTPVKCLASPDWFPPAEASARKSTVCGLNGCLPRLVNLARPLPFKSSTRLASSRLLRPPSFFRGPLCFASLRFEKYAPAYFFEHKANFRKRFRQLPKPRRCCGPPNRTKLTLILRIKL